MSEETMRRRKMRKAKPILVVYEKLSNEQFIIRSLTVSCCGILVNCVRRGCAAAF